jgi:hypothetical protein
MNAEEQPDAGRYDTAGELTTHDGAAERVGSAMAALEGLEGRPTATHVAAFEQVHAALTDALSAIDEV